MDLLVTYDVETVTKDGRTAAPGREDLRRLRPPRPEIGLRNRLPRGGQTPPGRSPTQTIDHSRTLRVFTASLPRRWMTSSTSALHARPPRPPGDLGTPGKHATRHLFRAENPRTQTNSTANRGSTPHIRQIPFQGPQHRPSGVGEDRNDRGGSRGPARAGSQHRPPGSVRIATYPGSWARPRSSHQHRPSGVGEDRNPVGRAGVGHGFGQHRPRGR